MPNDPAPTPRSSLRVKLGNRFEAQATGWGVAAVPVIILLLAAAALTGAFHV